MVGLQQIEVVDADLVAGALDVGYAVQFLAGPGIAHRFASEMRTRTHPRGDRRQRRGIALAPALEAAGEHVHQQGVLAAVADVQYIGHR